MDHVAIMKKSWGLTAKILTGEKTIESRWYFNRRTPWGKIRQGDSVYFKDSGESVRLKAKVSRVDRFSDLTPDRVWAILKKYGAADGLKRGELPKYFELFKNKRYCLLIHLANPQAVAPFDINKAGFGAMAAWLTVADIRAIKVLDGRRS